MESAPGGSRGTLGDVLYAQKGKSLVLEQEWAALVRAVAAGDEVALHALYERAHRPVYTLIVRMTANRLGLRHRDDAGGRGAGL